MVVEVTYSGGDTPNIFVWLDGKLIAKLWIYPNGEVKYRTFEPKTTKEILLFKLKR